MGYYMIPKLFSDKFKKRMKELNITVPQILGLHESKIVFYPFITGKGMQDIREVFKQTKEDDTELMNYYSKYIRANMDLRERALAISATVNQRITYKNDSSNYKKVEYWAKPIDVHRSGYDDCDGYSVLICYLIRLFGAKEHEVFVATGDINYPDGRTGGHAYVLILDENSLIFYPIEGSFYPNDARKKFWEVPHYLNKRYGKIWFVTNDFKSYSRIPWLRFV